MAQEDLVDLEAQVDQADLDHLQGQSVPQVQLDH
jgi:hypothetical protein